MSPRIECSDLVALQRAFGSVTLGLQSGTVGATGAGLTKFILCRFKSLARRFVDTFGFFRSDELGVEKRLAVVAQLLNAVLK